MRETIDSCILAPPLVEKQIKGVLFSIECSTPLRNFSPTTLPIAPPINLNSNAAEVTSLPSSFPNPTNRASLSPVFFLASLILAGYDLMSLNPRGSLVSIFDATSVKLPLSKKILNLVRAPILK